MTTPAKYSITRDQLQKLVPLLDHKQFAVMLRSVLELRKLEQQDDISVLNRIKAGLWEFFKAVNFVSDAQGRELLTHLTASISQHIAAWLTNDNDLPIFRITFAERRWVSWPGQSVWYDMLYNEFVQQMPEPAVLSVVCDVTALVLRQNRELYSKGNGNGHPPSSEQTDQPKDQQD